MKRTLAIAALLCASSAFAQSSPLEFKGVSLGATRAELLEKFPAFRCDADMCIATLSVANQTNGLEDFGGVRPTGYLVNLDGDKVAAVSIIFDSDMYPLLLAALSEKYGKPTSTQIKAVTNHAGAKFKSRSARWVRKDGNASLTERAEEYVDKGGLHLEASWFAAVQKRKSDAQSKAAAKKL
jgi:hypothetical protein